VTVRFSPVAIVRALGANATFCARTPRLAGPDERGAGGCAVAGGAGFTGAGATSAGRGVGGRVGVGGLELVVRASVEEVQEYSLALALAVSA
jgi:hypothetical protein